MSKKVKPPRSEIIRFDFKNHKMDVLISTQFEEYSMYGEEIRCGSDSRPTLLKSIAPGVACNLNLSEGYEPIGDNTSHGIYTLFEFEKKSNFLDKTPRIFDEYLESDVRFIMCRNVLGALVEALFTGQKFELLCHRDGDEVTIGINRQKMIDAEKNAPEKKKMGQYCGLNYAKLITEQKTGEKFKNFNESHSIVRMIRIKNSTRKHATTLFVSSVVRAFDENGNPVEVKTASAELDEDFFKNRAFRWWIRGYLSGADKIIYGLMDKACVVNNVKEIQMAALIDPGWKYSPNQIFEYLEMIFDGIKKLLPTPGLYCSVENNLSKDAVMIHTANSKFTEKSTAW